jgi:3-hydroxyacyl-[acyl-carrier-protein] dehydratase
MTSTANDEAPMTTEPATLPLEAADIMRILPHRYPFLLVDRIVELEPGKRAVGLKQVTANEPHFTGHFPDRPIMPGVLMVEALAQTAGIAVMTLDEYRGKLGLFAGIDDCRFKRLVVPGDTLRLEVTVEKLRGMFGRVRAVATVDGELAAEATLSIIIPRDQALGGGGPADA